MEQKHLDYAANCNRLLDIMHGVLELAMDSDSGGYTMESYARGLAIKYYNHAVTIWVLSNHDKAANIAYLPAAATAFSSIEVLTRAAIETFLVFHHVFVAPSNQEELEFRFGAYALAGCLERAIAFYGEGFYDLDLYGEDYIMYADRKAAQRFIRSLRQNSVLRNMQTKEQKRILSGRWRISHWSDIAKEAKLSEFISQKMYPYLCGYAHSGSLSVRQSQIIQNLGQQHSMNDTMLVLVNICTANMVVDYCGIFPSVRSVLSSQPQADTFVDLWVGAGRDKEPSAEFPIRSPWDLYDQNMPAVSNAQPDTKEE